MKQYKPIVVLVKSDDRYRVFVTKSFTIRSIVVMLQRYNPNYQIQSVSYGEYDGPSEWSEKKPILTSHFDVYNDNTEKELLEKFGYRDAMNYYYIQCAYCNCYPSKRPFRGVKTDLPKDNYYYGEITYPMFIRDEENPYENIEDVLCCYDGQRLDKYINGELVNGYLLTSCRKNNAENLFENE